MECGSSESARRYICSRQLQKSPSTAAGMRSPTPRSARWNACECAFGIAVSVYGSALPTESRPRVLAHVHHLAASKGGHDRVVSEAVGDVLDRNVEQEQIGAL